jgi:Galactose oxidase-like, Early set domain
MLRTKFSRRVSGKLLGGAVPLLVVLPSVVVAAGFPASSAPRTASVDARHHVCHGLTPDADYSGEAAQLGAEHACEHLRERYAARNRTPAMRAAAARAFRRSYDRAEAALPTTDPAVIGSWSTATNPGTKTIGISAVLLHTGKVLLFGGKYKSTDKNTAAYLYDPVTRTGHEVPAPAPVFCGSVTQLSDGRVLTAGGADPIPKGIVDLWLFNPISEQWIRQPDTPLGRYYPTSTRLPDGRIVITAGSELNGSTPNPTVELFTPPAAGGSVGTLHVVGPKHATGVYPRQWVMPDGKMLQVTGLRSFQLNPSTWTWTALKQLPGGNSAGSAGLMLPAGPSGSSRVMMIGGLKNGVATPSTEEYDYSNPAAGWSFGPPMPTARAHMNVVQLPDGSAIAVGGNSSTLYGAGQPQTMAYDPSTDSWTDMAVQTVRRAYHSTAILLPDGRIMSAGDGGAGGGRQRIDFYSPPYLFKGPRPVIDSAPSQVNYGATFSIGASGPVATQAVLMAPAATTHANEMNARHVKLAVTPGGGGFTATAPTAAVAPPGYYMLFVLTASGIPSIARWVHVGP